MESIEQQLNQIEQFQMIHPHLLSSILPSKDQIEQIKAYGVDTLIHIAPNQKDTLSDALDQHCLILQLNYIQIPLDFECPAIDQAILVLDFIDYLCRDKIVWLSCPDYQRCSSLLYVYRQYYMQMDIATAQQLFHQTWEPNNTWTGLIHALTLQLQGRKATQELQQELNQVHD